MDNDIFIRATIAAWPRWKQLSVTVATIALLGYSIWYYLFLNSIR